MKLKESKFNPAIQAEQCKNINIKILELKKTYKL